MVVPVPMADNMGGYMNQCQQVVRIMLMLSTKMFKDYQVALTPTLHSLAPLISSMAIARSTCFDVMPLVYMHISLSMYIILGYVQVPSSLTQLSVQWSQWEGNLANDG
jgi:hypothetical protein